MRNITSLIFYNILLAAVVFSSCTSDEAGGQEAGIPVAINVGAATRGGNDPALSGLHYGDGIDSDIEKIRVLGYRSSDGVLAFNRVVAVTIPGGTVSGTIDVVTGTFTFVFIANEDSDPTLASTLADNSSVGTLAKLKETSFGYTAFDEGKYIPMVTAVDNVQVTGDNSIITPSETINNGTWTVNMERLAVRLELHLEMQEDFAAANPVLSFENVPDRVYLFQRENISSVHTRTIDASLLTSNVSSQNGKTLSWKRIILPEAWFADKADDDNAVNVSLSTSTESKKAPLGYEPDTDYTLPRNYYFKLEGSVTPSSIEYSAVVKDWDDALVGTILDGQFFLDISQSYILFNRYGGLDEGLTYETVIITVETDYDITNQGYPKGLYFDIPTVSWANITPSGAEGDLQRTIAVRMLQNNNTSAARTAEIKVRVGNVTKSILIEQDYRSL